MKLINHIYPNSHCDLCGVDIATHCKVVARGLFNQMGVCAPLSTVICRGCGFVFQRERFSETLLSELYKSDRSFDFSGNEHLLTKVELALIERQSVISRAIDCAGIKTPARVIDVGGGRGECVRHLVPRHNVVVADVTPESPIDSRIEKISGLFSANMIIEKFDVVVMNHVLEHVCSPTELLVSSNLILNDRGIIIIEVPFELYTPVFFGRLGDWRHLSYFSRHTIKLFTEKAGFSIKRLALEMGAYGTRRLPVIRLVAQKIESCSIQFPKKGFIAPLLFDMTSPVVLASLINRALGRS
jgi:hypothetical protein